MYTAKGLLAQCILRQNALNETILEEEGSYSDHAKLDANKRIGGYFLWSYNDYTRGSDVITAFSVLPTDVVEELPAPIKISPEMIRETGAYQQSKVVNLVDGNLSTIWMPGENQLPTELIINLGIAIRSKGAGSFGGKIVIGIPILLPFPQMESIGKM